VAPRFFLLLWICLKKTLQSLEQRMLYICCCLALSSRVCPPSARVFQRFPRPLLPTQSSPSPKSASPVSFYGHDRFYSVDVLWILVTLQMPRYRLFFTLVEVKRIPPLFCSSCCLRGGSCAVRHVHGCPCACGLVGPNSCHPTAPLRLLTCQPEGTVVVWNGDGD